MMKKKLFIGSLIVTTGLMVTSIGASLGWFTNDMISSIDRLGGSVLESYFHSGNGTEASPFTITTPWHYENFVKLHYNAEGFDNGYEDAPYYFEFGVKGLNESEPNEYYFYSTNENGVVSTDSYSKVLNLGGEVLPPLGTDELPFKAHLNGNNLTISNFTIAGSGYHDVGIFGFVSGRDESTNDIALVENCYWKNFKIDTTGISKAKFGHPSSSGDSRYHPDYGTMGYLAGHVYESSSFKNCYVNDCTINGKAQSDRAVDTYGYYGKVERDQLGSSIGKGDNYSFTLNSKDVYNSIANNYNSIRDNPLRTRVGTEANEDEGRHYADYDFPLQGETEWANNAAAHPVSEAITRVNNSTYRLNGTTVETYADRNYSLSTVGYQPLTGNLRNEYEISSSDSRWTNPDNVTLDKNAPSIDKQYNSGDFFKYDSSSQQWYYQHSQNDSTTMAAANTYTFSLSCSSEFSLSESGGDANPSIKEMGAYFYIDGKEVFTTSVSASIERTGSIIARKYRFYNISLGTNSFTYDLKRGLHYYAFFIAFRTANNALKYACLYDSNNSFSIERVNSIRKGFSVGQAELEINQNNYNTTSLSFSATSSAGQDATSNDSYVIMVDNKAWDGVVPPYIHANSYEIPLIGTNRTNGAVGPLKESSIDKFTRETITDTEYHDDGTTSTTTRKVWVATDNPTRAIDYSADPVYFSDGQSLIDANYKYKNIDVVGGNVTFTYIDSILFIPVDLEIISLPSETAGTNIVEVPLTSYFDNEAQFYATEHCPGTIVMYVNNTANAYDSIDSQIGHIDFTYANMNINGQSLINVERPSFKKGSGQFIDILTLGRIKQPTQTVNFLSTFQGDITESGAKKTSFVCLDESGKMLGVFDANGNPGYGFYKQATNEPANERYIYNPGTNGRANGTYTQNNAGTYVLDKEKFSRIDTYVIVLGCSSRSSQNTAYITEIKFNYKSHDGAGGSFGQVGYRDSAETIEDTILNFYLDIPENATYSAKVSFNGTSYTITLSASAELYVNIFNYQSDTYSVVVNGTVYENTEVIEFHYTP